MINNFVSRTVRERRPVFLPVSRRRESLVFDTGVKEDKHLLLMRVVSGKETPSPPCLLQLPSGKLGKPEKQDFFCGE